MTVRLYKISFLDVTMMEKKKNCSIYDLNEQFEREPFVTKKTIFPLVQVPVDVMKMFFRGAGPKNKKDSSLCSAHGLLRKDVCTKEN